MMHLPNFGGPAEPSSVVADDVSDDDDSVYAKEPVREDVEVPHHNEVPANHKGGGGTWEQVHRGPTLFDFLGSGYFSKGVDSGH